MARLVLLFLAVPLVELALLIEIGQRLGTVATLALLVLTGLVGAALARMQGVAVLRQVQRDLTDGRLPASSLVDGMIVLIAGALLITPGVLTDLVGFLCLIPAFRRRAKAYLWRRFSRAVEARRVRVYVDRGDFIDVEGGVSGATPDRRPRES